jgi:radical SAM protein with 4Fe4S-binding SPASM domain
MPFDLFNKIIDQCFRHYSLGDLVFSGLGEPLLHPRLLEMSKLAKRKGIPNVRLITNAILLTRQKTLEILEDSGFDEIGLSLDANSEETYQKVKNSAKFQIAQDNIAYFLSQKQWKPFVSLHILKMRETADEISDFIKKWSSLLGKGDHILIKDVHNFAGQVEERRLEEQIYRGGRFPCRQLWGFLYISWNGDVMPCCMDVFKKLRLGNLRNSSLQQLWNSPFLQGIRRIHLQERYEEIPLCSHCGNWWYSGKEPKKR